MNILGLNATGYNTATALLVDGDLVFAVEEERLIREKRTRAFPAAGIKAALAHAQLSLDDIDVFAIGWNPAINLETHNATQMGRARYLGEILYSVPGNLMALDSGIAASECSQTFSFAGDAKTRIEYVTHHRAHAASYFMSPFDEAAILTTDAFGEKQSVTFNRGRGALLETLGDQEFPHALGSFYACFTEYCGFKPQSDEWKLMGASPYGNANAFAEKLRSLVELLPDGRFALDLRFFNHYQFHRPLLHTPRLIELLGISPNSRDNPPSEVYYDLAAAAQLVFEEVYFHMIRGLHTLARSRNLVISGGAALNSVANGKVAEQTPFENVFVPPVPDDSGCSVGAALHVHHHTNHAPRRYVMTHNYLGPEYDDTTVRMELDRCKIPYETLSTPAERGAELIANGNILGWFQGRLEFGDRALGGRSILADPRDPKMKDLVNETVKYREPFRPFAPSILAECVDDYFLRPLPTPFMEKVFSIRPEKRAVIPAVTHVDGSGRLQTVRRDQNELYYDLIAAFARMTGVPVVLNTSFNLKGEAMVCSPRDAIRTFFSSGLDALIVGRYLVSKTPK